jgi:DNA-binding protein HU-beta
MTGGAESGNFSAIAAILPQMAGPPTIKITPYLLANLAVIGLRSAYFRVFRASFFPRESRIMATQPGTGTKPKVTTISTKQLAATLAGDHEMPKKQAEALLGDLIGLLTKHLKKGDRIRLNGLGILVVRKRAARMGRNPATGEPIQIKASKKVAFRAAKELKEAV